MSDRNRRSLVERVLGDAALFPDSFKVWIPRQLAGNVNLQLEQYQLPAAESVKRVGDTGNSAFQGTWANYGSGNEEAGYYKDPYGRVHISGFVKDGVSGTVIFTLPGSYVPENRQSFIVLTGAADQIGRVDVLANGDVQHISGAVDYVQLNVISFRSFGG